MSLFNQVILIVGAAGGIGRSVAVKMAEAGGRIIIADLDRINLGKLKEELTASEVALEVIDITNKSEIDDMIGRVVSRFGRLDVLVNAAGICEFIGFQEVTEEKWDQMLAVNLKGPFYICRAAADVMIKQQSGKIVNIASIAGENAAVYAGIHYSVSKSGLITMSKVLAKTLAQYGIRVNVVSPGPVETEMLNCWTPEMREHFCAGIPLGKFADPDDIAGAVMFLVGPESDYITGQVLRLNGGALV